MKSIKKIFAGLLMATAAFGFFGCSDSEEDDELTVAFEESGTTEKTVKMTASSTNSDGHKVFVIYTLDGSEPKADMISGYDKTQFATDVLAAEGANATDEQRQKVLSYVGCGTADVIESGKSITVSESTTITAKAFYIVATDGKPLKTGPKATKEITITPDTTGVTDSDNNKSGTLNFKLAKTGNTNSTHYYDTSAATFAYEGNSNCYYQIQFSWKGTNKGNWYLYVRKLGSSAPIVSTAGTKFVAKGTFEGSALNNLIPTQGDLTLKYVNAKTGEASDFATVNVSAGNESAFSLTVNETNGKTNIQSAIDANDAK